MSKGARLFAKLHDENGDIPTRLSACHSVLLCSKAYPSSGIHVVSGDLICSEYLWGEKISCAAEVSLGFSRIIPLFQSTELVQHAVLYAHHFGDSG